MHCLLLCVTEWYLFALLINIHKYLHYCISPGIGESVGVWMCVQVWGRWR